MAIEKYPPITETDVVGLTAALATKEALANKKQTVTNSETDYPSGKAVYDALVNKLDKYIIYDNGSSLAIDGANGTWFTSSIAASAELTLSNIAIGIEYTFKIYNSVADNTEGNGVYVTINSGATHLINYHSKNVFIPPADCIIIKMIYDGTNYLYTLVKGKELPTNCTIVVPYGMTADNMQLLVSSFPKDFAGYTLTYQLADCPYKYFNGTTDQIVGNGTTATVTHAGHGFTNGDEISINAEYAVTNFDGDYIITVIDENTYTFASTVNATLVPTSAAIARKVWDLGDSYVEFTNYIKGILIVQGNRTETDYDNAHTTQRVYLKSTGNYCLRFAYSTVYEIIYNIKAKAVKCPTYQRQMKEVYQVYCHNLNNSATNAATSPFSFYMCQTVIIFLCVGGSYNATARGACISSSLSNLCSSNNSSYNATTQYGLYCESGHIYKKGTQPTGTIANEGLLNGGNIWPVSE